MRFPVGFTGWPTTPSVPTPTATRPDLDLVAEAQVVDRTGDIVPIPRRLPGDEHDGDIRRSDVDAWGRSEHIRQLTRRLYDPIYKHWFRVEWEHFDRLPADRRRAARRQPRGRDPARRPGDHARHRATTRPEGVRPGREPVPVAAGDRHAVGARWRCHRPSRQRVPPAARRRAVRARVPRGHQGDRQAVHRALPTRDGSVAAASSRSPCARACRSCRSRSSAPRSRCRSCSRAAAWPR